jgi:hypothetical protein
MTDYYFNNKKVEELIQEYKQTGNEIIKNSIMKNILEIIVRVISLYKYDRFEERDDLIQHASEACFKSIKNFDPNHPKYSSAFNWFSLTTKRSLLNYTLRKKKHRGHHSIYEFFHLEYEKKFLSIYFLKNDLQKEFFNIIDKNFLGQQRENYIKISIILVNYLSKTRKFKKTDFYAWSRSHGFTNSMCRQFIKDINIKYNKLLENILDENVAKMTGKTKLFYDEWERKKKEEEDRIKEEERRKKEAKKKKTQKAK